MKIKDIVDRNRIITVSESSELYTENINEILQREINASRINALSDYISTNPERFLGSMVVAIHEGTPKWTEIDINSRFEVDRNEIDLESIEFLNSKFGVLTLTGNEQIFALDGQHRLMGLRKSYEANREIGELEISLIFVVHKHDQLNKTRRLFTVLNKYAEKPKGAELIILDEDDAAAIISRKLVSEHPVLSLPNGISGSKTGAISASDNSSFTTLVTINSINKILFAKRKDFYAKRPSDRELELLYEKASTFWDTIFEVFPELVSYVSTSGSNLQIDSEFINRNDSSGGSLLLRPVGQQLLATAYTRFAESELNLFKVKLRQINFNLSSENWKYVFWNGNMLGKEAALKKKLILFMLGKNNDSEDLHTEMRRVYESHNEDYQNHIVPV